MEQPSDYRGKPMGFLKPVRRAPGIRNDGREAGELEFKHDARGARADEVAGYFPNAEMPHAASRLIAVASVPSPTRC